MILADSHCHLDFPDYGDERAEIIARARAASVLYLLNAGVTPSRWPGIIDLVAGDPCLFAAVGVHPNEILEGQPEPDADDIVQAASHPKVVAIGETGLDYYRSPADAPWQLERFRRHIAAARQSGKPIIVHTRAAAADTLRLMAEEGADAVGGVIHCFTEDWEFAKVAMDMGFHISFSGIITFKKSIDLQEVARKVPWDRLLVETDAPFLAPVPYRGKRNEPAYVVEVAKKIAEIKGVSLERVAEETTRNFLRLFRIPEHTHETGD